MVEACTRRDDGPRRRGSWSWWAHNGPEAPWSVGGTPAGELRQAANFSFLRVYDAGHMVPRDQPERSLAMLNAFISDTL